MKIFNISADPSCLESESALAKRLVLYGELVQSFTVLVAAPVKTSIPLSRTVMVHSVKKQNKIFTWIALYFQAKTILRKDAYSIITTQDHYFLGFLSWILAKQFGLGLEVQVHGWEKGTGVRDMLAKFILPRAQSVRVVSNRLKDKVVREYGVVAEKITVVPIYIEDRAKGFVRDFDVEKKTFVFLTVGRLVEVKNIPLQIEAMAEIVKKYPDTKLWIVGEGPTKSALEKLIQERELSSQVTLFGWKSANELDELYKQADAFLLTSFNEGWPRVIVEAGSFSLPIIQTDVGSAHELIHSGDNGIILSIGEKSVLSQAMEKVLTYKDLRKKIGTHLKDSVQALPDLSQTLNLYQRSWNKAQKIL